MTADRSNTADGSDAAVDSDDAVDRSDGDAGVPGSATEPGLSDDCCDCAGGRTEAPSIYQAFWRDDRAELARRDYAKALATIGGLTAVASLAAPIASLTQVFERGYSGPVYSDGVALVDAAGERVSEGRLATGEQLTVFPESHPGISDAPTLLVRFAEDQYGGTTDAAFTVGGYAAYSKVCTHAGCMVADRDGDTLVCPCHSGRFDPLSGAAVTGGPPPRALPQLPITVSSDGYLIATGDFEGAVGPGGE
jgi:rieske iron-sulfur protein